MLISFLPIGQVNPDPVPSDYYAPEVSVFFRETDKANAIVNSAEYSVEDGDDSTRETLLDVSSAFRIVINHLRAQQMVFFR